LASELSEEAAVEDWRSVREQREHRGTESKPSESEDHHRSVTARTPLTTASRMHLQRSVYTSHTAM